MSQRSWLVIATIVTAVAAVVALHVLEEAFGFDRVLTLWAPALVGVALPVVFVALVRLAFHFTSRDAPASTPLRQRTPGLWSDESVDLDRDDRFGRKDFADAIVGVVDRIGLGQPSSVIGLSGSWGSGKTSVIDHIVKTLRRGRPEKPRWIVASLNPWRYKSTSDLIAGFFVELRSALPDHGNWTIARETLSDLLEASAPLGLLAGPIGIDGSSALKSMAVRIRGQRPAEKAQIKAQRALAVVDRPILFVIDDMDRLEPDELLSLFRLVRLLGRLPNVHYLLGYDEETVSDVLAQTALVSSRRRARQYLEKIVQVRLDVPPLRDSQADKAVDVGLNEIGRHLGIELEPRRSGEFALTYQAHLSRTLRTPRAIQRWLTHVELLLAPLAEDVDFFDFVLIVWLRLLRPQVAAMLQEHKAAIFSQGGLALALSPPDPVKQHADWMRWLRSAKVARGERDEVFRFLADLFPTIRQAYEKSSSSPNLEIARRRQGVGHPDYFERYFTFGVPEDELRESDFARGMTSIAIGMGSETILGFLVKDPRSLIPRIEDWVAQNPASAIAVVEWLIRNSGAVSDFGLLSGRSAIRGAIFRVLRNLDPGDAIQLVLSLASVETPDDVAEPALLAASDLLRESGWPEVALEFVRNSIVGPLRQRTEANTTEPSLRPRSFWTLLWIWVAVDPGGLRDWYRSQVELGNWTIVEAVAGIVSSATPVGVPNPVSQLRGVPSSSVESFLGIAWCAHYVQNHPEELAGERSSSDDFDGPIDTWDNRLAVARRYLDSLLDSKE